MNTKISYIGSAVILIGSILLLLARPLEDQLGDQGQLALVGIVLTLGIWIFRPFGLPFSAGAFFFAAYMLAIGLPAATVFSGYTHSAIWTLVAALFFGFVLQKTGLGHRVAFMILKLFKPTYVSMIIAWTLIGVALSLLTPSMTVRVAIMMPIAVNCCELCGLKPGSKGNSLILLTAFIMALIPGEGWLTGSLTGPVIQGSFESVEALQGVLTSNSYLKMCIIPLELTTVLVLVGSLIFFRPEEKLSAEAAKAIREEKLGRISRDEVVTAVILIICFLLFFFGETLGISSLIVCLGATFLFFAFGIIKPTEVGTGISWDLIVFLGMALALGNICQSTGIIDWLSSLVVPALAPVSGNPYLFVGTVTAFLFVWHLVDIACYFPTFIILPPILPAISKAYGVDPLVFVPILCLACCAFFMAYQNQWAIMSERVAKERSWTAGHLFRYSLIYFGASMISILVCVPIFQSWGLIG
ncbi:MAG: anion permease [Firmicutes bacterium]|nr:anion permease [Bacillota bacterium]